MIAATQKQAKYTNVLGASIELFARNSANTDYEPDAKQLCGVNTLGYSDGGGGEELDITDFCWGLTGTKRKISGLKEEGSLSVGLILFDPEQEGQKFLNDLPLNSLFKMVVKFEYESQIAVVTYELRKTKGADHNLEVGKAWAGGWQFGVITDPKFTIE